MSVSPWFPATSPRRDLPVSPHGAPRSSPPPLPVRRQGLTLVHFSAQPEPFLTQNNTLHISLHILNIPKDPLHAPPIPKKALYVALKSERV